MVRNKILLILGMLSLLLNTVSYAAGGNASKPVIEHIAYYSGNWNVYYTDVKMNAGLSREELFIDNISAREVNAGTATSPYKRGFPIRNASYDMTVCHKAYIVVYDNAHKEVSRSDTYMFGDTTKCSTPPTVTKPEIQSITHYSGKWNLRYKDIPFSSNLGVEAIYVDRVLDREVPAGITTNGLLRGFSLTKTYSESSCHKAYIVVYDKSRNELKRSDTYMFGDTTKCTNNTNKIIIDKIVFSKGKWNIRYKDVPTAANLSREDVHVDGVLDRSVSAGTNNPSLTRGFSLNNTYSDTSCHKATISLYDTNNNLVEKSDLFEFGDISKCGVQTDTVKPVITLIGGDVTLTVGDTYTDAGATALDDVDGDITSDINTTTNVDTSVAGTYEVKYNVKDQAGNVATEVLRKVVVSDTFNPVLTHEVVLCQNKSAYINKLYTLGMTINSNVATGTVLSKDNNFVGAVLCAKYTTETSSAAVLTKLKNAAFPTAVTVISNTNADGSIKAQYEVNGANTQAFAQLKSILQAAGETDFSNYTDFSTFDSVQNFLVDIFVQYVDSSTTYIIVTVTDKNVSNVNDLNTLVTQNIINVSNSQSVETDVFTYNGNTLKADILFVMDDSGSMREEQAAASNAIVRTFGTAMTTKGIDWKATVIGTERSRNYLNRHINDPSINDITKLSNQLILGTNGYDEVGLLKAYRHLSNGSISVRANSKLSIVYISDEPAHTSLREMGGITNIDDSYFVQNNIKFNVIIPLRLSNNRNLAYQMANKTGAEVANITNYANGYDAMMQKISDDAAGSASQIILTRTPIIASIQVLVNGTVVGTGWTYNPSNNSIVFDIASVPNSGDSVSITYNY
jgi:hypothetical protein